MSNLFSFQKYDKNNVVCFKDTVYKSKAKKIFKVALTVCCIICILLSAAYATRDLLLGRSVGYGNLDSNGNVSTFAPDAQDKESEVVCGYTVSYATARSFASSSATEITGIVLNDATFVYDGTPKSISIEGTLPMGVNVVYSNNENTNAGVYTVTAELSGEGYAPLTLTATVTINKAMINPVSLSDKFVTYNGEAQTLYISGEESLPDGVEAEYTIHNYEYTKELDEAVNVGKYWITATMSGNNNYEALVLRALLTIEKANIEGVIFEDGSFTFDGSNKAIYAEYDAEKYSDVSVSYTGNVMSYAGNHTATVTLKGDNYNTLTLSANLYISKSRINPDDLYFESKIFTYNGFGFTFSYNSSGSCNMSEKVATVQHPSVYGIPVTANVSYRFIKGNGIDAGEHIIEASISGVNYENSVVLTKNYTIERADITAFVDVPSSIRYNEKAHRLQVYFKGVDEQGQEHTQLTYSGIECEYYYDGSCIILGDYGVTITLSGHNYNTLVIEKTLTVVKGLIDTSKIIVSAPELIYNGKVKEVNHTWFSGIPDGASVDCTKAYATNAGVHSLAVTLSKEHYEDCIYPVTMTIHKGKYGGIKYSPIMYRMQPLEEGELVIPYIANTLTGTTVIKYFWNGEEINGVRRLGTYNIDVMVYDENREAEFTVELWILPNPFLLLIGLLIGIVVGIITAILSLINRRSVEKRSKKHFEKIHGGLTSERGGIICESRVKLFDGDSLLATKDKDGAKHGRLYLTRYAVEYYDEHFTENYRNFLIRTDDILSVDVEGSMDNRLIICSKGKNQIFTVPTGTASLWRREILHFKNIDQKRFF